MSAKDMGSRYWTSGMLQGCKNKEKLAWCGSGDFYSQAELGPVEGITDSKKCVVLGKQNGVLSLSGASCSERNRPLCEVLTNQKDTI
jgi:hypothetical protein